MDYKIKNLFLFFSGLNIFSSLLLFKYIEYKNLSLYKELEKNKIADEIVYSKIVSLDEKIQKINDFNQKMLENKIIYGQNRDWDDESSDEFTDVD